MDDLNKPGTEPTKVIDDEVTVDVTISGNEVRGHVHIVPIAIAIIAILLVVCGILISFQYTGVLGSIKDIVKTKTSEVKK